MDDHYDYDDYEVPTCPRCDGYGSIDCYCGGDLCVCTNYGDRTCPVCGGEGSISNERYEQYQAAQDEWWAAYQATLAARQSRFDKAAPWKIRKPKPPTSSKRDKVKAARKQRQRNG